QALLGGGELDGTRVLGSRTLAYMARNHLPGGADLESFGRRLFAETTFDGVGYGLGFAVLLDPVANKVLSTPGELAWGGAASTFFWVDPAEQLTAIFLTSYFPTAPTRCGPSCASLSTSPWSTDWGLRTANRRIRGCPCEVTIQETLRLNDSSGSPSD